MIKGKAALMVIDVQKGLLDRESVFFDQENVDIINRIGTLVEACRKADIPIIYVKEVHRPSGIDFGRELDGSEGVHALSNSPRTEIADEVGRLPYDPLISKPRYSCFLYTDTEVVLKGLGIFPNDTLIMCGFLTDVCVHYTFVDAHQRDYRIKVVEGCCAGSTPEAHEASLRAMEYLQRESPVSLDKILEDIENYR